MQSQPYIIANGGPSLIVGAKSAICLGIARIITGSLILLLAIITVPLLGWRNYRGFIILSGVVVCTAGVLSLCFVAKGNAGVYKANRFMAFASALYMLVDSVIFCAVLFDLNQTATCLAINSCLLVLSVAEFVMAVTVEISWYNSCCTGCCYGKCGEVDQQSHTTISSALVQSSAHTSYQSCYPAASSQHAFGSLAPPPYSSHQEDTSTNSGNAAPPMTTLEKFDANFT